MAKLMFTFKVWLCVWFMVTGLSFCIIRMGTPMPLVLRTLIVTVIVAPSMVYVIIPFLQRKRG